MFWKIIKPHDKCECPVTLSSFHSYLSELCSQSTTLRNSTHTCAFLQHYYCTVELDKEISIIEVEHAIKLLKCSKSPGQDNVLNECIKHGGAWITHIITTCRLCNHLYNLGTFPDEWSESRINLKSKATFLRCVAFALPVFGNATRKRCVAL